MNLFEFFEGGDLSELRNRVNSWIEKNGIDVNTWDFSSQHGYFILVVYYSEANPGNKIGFRNEKDIYNTGDDGPFS
jgi:hypothetical protein